jgi:hypothetical protein
MVYCNCCYHYYFLWDSVFDLWLMLEFLIYFSSVWNISNIFLLSILHWLRVVRKIMVHDFNSFKFVEVCLCFWIWSVLVYIWWHLKRMSMAKPPEQWADTSIIDRNVKWVMLSGSNSKMGRVKEDEYGWCIFYTCIITLKPVEVILRTGGARRRKMEGMNQTGVHCIRIWNYHMKLSYATLLYQ